MNEEDNELQEQEQNSIGKEIANQAIQQGKNAAQNKAKAVLVKLMPIIIKVVAIVLIVIMVIILFAGAIYIAKNKINEIAGGIGDAIVSICKIGDNGPVIPGMQDVIDSINEELEKNQINKEGLRLGNNLQADIYLYKYMATALSTELPYIKDSKAEILRRIATAYITAGLSEIINKETEIQGIIHIKRTETDIASARDLKFIKYDKFTKKIEKSDGDTKDYFSIDDDWNLCVAKSYKVTVNGAVTQFTLEEVKIPYRTLVAQYTMPFQFLLNLQQISSNAEYVSAVADLINDDGEIEFMILDCMETTTEVYTYNHSIKSKTLVENEVETDTNSSATGGSSNSGSTTTRSNKNTARMATSTKSQLTMPTTTNGQEGASDTTKTKVQEVQTSGPTEQPEEKTTTVIEENTIKANVTKANVWVINQITTYNLQETETEPMGPDGITTYIDDEQEPADPTTVGQTVSWKVDQRENTYQKVNTKEWQVGETNTQIDADKFLGLWRNATGTYVEGASYKPERQGGIAVKYQIPSTLHWESPVPNIYSAEQMLYTLLENGENTQTHATLMKYLIKLYKTGEPLDTADVELDMDLSVYNPTEFVEGSYIGAGFDIHDESLFITDIEQLKKALSGYSNSSKLVANAQAFLDMQNKYKVNALFAAAVSIIETSGGTRGNAVNGHNNWFNIRGRNGWAPYTTAAEGIDAFGNLIANGSYYYKQGKYTVADIGYTYCPNTPEYPTQADNWIVDVNAQMTKFYNTAGIDVSAYTSGSYTGGKDLNSLFPNGIPKTESEMQQYLTQVVIVVNNKQGKKETRTLTVHKAVAEDVKQIFTEIQASGFKVYSVGAYSWRSAAASSSRSHHSYGVAIDINPNENYMIKNGRIVAGSLWKPGTNEYSITPNGPVVRAFTSRGWTWGGTWSSSKDYMHFSLTGH